MAPHVVQSQNKETYKESEAKAQRVNVPDGLRSRESSVSLEALITNERSDNFRVYWVNYSGQASYLGQASPGGWYRVYTHGTNPWLITTTSDELIFYSGQSEIHSQLSERPDFLDHELMRLS